MRPARPEQPVSVAGLHQARARHHLPLAVARRLDQPPQVRFRPRQLRHQRDHEGATAARLRGRVVRQTTVEHPSYRKRYKYIGCVDGVLQRSGMSEPGQHIGVHSERAERLQDRVSDAAAAPPPLGHAAQNQRHLLQPRLQAGCAAGDRRGIRQLNS